MLWFERTCSVFLREKNNESKKSKNFKILLANLIREENIHSKYTSQTKIFAYCLFYPNSSKAISRFGWDDWEELRVDFLCCWSMLLFCCILQKFVWWTLQELSWILVCAVLLSGIENWLTYRYSPLNPSIFDWRTFLDSFLS